jgi:ribosomal subunit interface protein
MKINIVSRQLDLTRSLENFTVEKFAALESICGEMLSAEVVLTHDDGENPSKRFRVGVRLAVPGRDVYASECGPDLHAAIDGVQNKLSRRLRKRKTRFENGRRQVQRAAERLRDWGGATPGIPESAIA